MNLSTKCKDRVDPGIRCMYRVFTSTTRLISEFGLWIVVWYLCCLFRISMEEVDRLAHIPNTVVISCEMKLNMDYLLERMWQSLALIRVFTKKPGNAPDLGMCLM